MKIQSLLQGAVYVSALLFSLCAPRSARAVTLVVTNTNNEGRGSLRQAIEVANAVPSNDVITFNLPATANTINLMTGGVSIRENGTLRINGPGASRLTIVGARGMAGVGRVFSIDSGAQVTFTGFSLAKAQTVAIGNGGLLTLENVELFSNSDGGISGGAVQNIGTLRVRNSIFRGNNALFEGGAIYNTGVVSISHCTFAQNSALRGGAIHNGGWLTIDNSTFIGNSGTCIYNNRGIASIDSSTIVRNSADDEGAGLRLIEGTMDLNNSIVAGNTTRTGTAPNISGVVTSGDYNLVDDATGATLPGDHNIIGQNARLGQLAENGGPTPTIALLTGSPAVDAGNTALSVDQRGRTRPVSLHGGASTTGDNGSDIGAFESTNNELVISGVTISPEQPQLTDQLVASVVVEAGKSLTYTYLWKKNGMVIEGANGPTLNPVSAAGAKEGDQISLTVTISSGSLSSEPVTSNTVTLMNRAPVVESLSPLYAVDKVGDKRTFSVTVSDGNGVRDIKEVWLLINERLSWNAGATLIYVPSPTSVAKGQLFLRSGDAFLPPLDIGIGSRAVLDNGAVSVSAREVTVTVQGSNLTLNLPLTLRDGLVGANREFARVSDKAGATDPVASPGDDGYIRFDDYYVTPQFSDAPYGSPTLSRLQPGAMYSTLDSAELGPVQNFTFSASAPNGTGAIESLWFLAGKERNWTKSATFIYTPKTRRLVLRSDDGNSFLGGGVVGTAGVLENSQVRLDLSKVRVLSNSDGKTLGLVLPLQAKAGLLGQNKVWLRVQDNSLGSAPNGDEQGYVQSGYWTVGQGTAGALSAGGS